MIVKFESLFKSNLKQIPIKSIEDQADQILGAKMGLWWISISFRQKSLLVMSNLSKTVCISFKTDFKVRPIKQNQIILQNKTAFRQDLCKEGLVRRLVLYFILFSR